MKRLRLLKVIVQPVLVMDDGETLTEIPAQAVTVAVADLDALPGRLRDELKLAEIQLNEQAEEPVS